MNSSLLSRYRLQHTANNELYRCQPRATGTLDGQDFGPANRATLAHEVKRTRGEFECMSAPACDVRSVARGAPRSGVVHSIERCQKLVLILAVRSTVCRLSHQSSQSIPQSSIAGRLATPGGCATISRNPAQIALYTGERILHSPQFIANNGVTSQLIPL